MTDDTSLDPETEERIEKPVSAEAEREVRMTPTEAVAQTVRDHTGLTVAHRDAFGAHYAETLRLWRERFTERADQVAALGFDDTFRRLWTFYLAYSEAGFRSGYLDVQQYLLTKPATADEEAPAR